MSMTFKVGSCYPAVPALEGARRRMVVVIGRSDEGRVQIAWVDDLSTETVKAIYDREFVEASRPDGVYTISAACELGAADAADVFSMLRRSIDRKSDKVR